MAKEKYLHDAIKTIVNSYGKKLYYDKRMINYISDYYSFDPLALYNVMKTLIADGYAGQLIDASQNGDWKIYVTQSIAKVQKNYGFAPIYVNYCFQSLAYGIGLYPTINKRLLDEVEGRSPSIPSSPSAPASPTSRRNQGQSVNQPTKPQKPTPSQRNRNSGANRQPPLNPSPPRNQGSTYPPFRPSPGNPSPQPQGSSSKQQVSLSKGCGCSGCFDSLTNTYVIIIIILWVIAQCGN